MLKSRTFKTLLDVGCGEGKLLLELSHAFPGATLAGVDYSAQSISFARAFNPELEFFVADISAANVGKRYDVITLIETLEHIPPESLARFIRGLATHLEDAGVLILTTPSETVQVNAKHYQHFTVEKVRSLFAEHFVIEEGHHLNVVGFGTNFIQRILSNRLFILNHAGIRTAVYRLYRTYFFRGKPEKTRRVCVVLRKKGNAGGNESI